MRGLIILLGLIPMSLYSQTELESGSRVLVIVEKESSSVGFYTEMGDRIRSLQLETVPHEMRFSPDRKHAYITNTGAIRYTDDVPGGTTISVVNLQEMDVLVPIALLPYRRPHGIDMDSETGLLAVGMENPDKVLLVDPVTGTVLKAFDSHGKTPHMVTISTGAQWIYASNIASANVVAINTDTGEHLSIDVGFKPQESVLSPDEKLLYVGCDEYTSVIDLELRKEVDRIPNGANRLELIQDGKLLLLASTKYGVGFADATTFEMIHHLNIPYKPYSLHVSEDEQLIYVSAEEQGVVYTVSVADMKIVRQFHVGSGIRPDPVMDFRLESDGYPDIAAADAVSEDVVPYKSEQENAK